MRAGVGVLDACLGKVGLARRSDDLTGLDTRGGDFTDPFGEVGFALMQLGVGGSLTRAQVESISAAFACVDVISSAIAALPPVVERVEGRRRVVVSDHPLAGLLERPNRWQNWPDFIQWLVAEALWEGNGLAVIESGGSLAPARWSGVQPVVQGGQPAFWVTPESWPGDVASRNAGRRFYRGGRVLHLADRTDDGRIGVARRKRAGGSVELAYRTMRASQAAYRNALMPSGALSFQRRLTVEQKAALRAQIRSEMAGDENAGVFMLLDEGADFKPITMTPRDGDLISAAQNSVPEVCRVFEVPPPLVQDYQFNTFTNATQAGVWFAKFCLPAWVAKIEAEITGKVFGEGYRFRLDMSGLQRGDVAERWSAYDKALQYGVLTPEQVAAMEGWV